MIVSEWLIMDGGTL